MKQHTIISLGEVLWDLFPDEDRFGGAPANFACHAALAGGAVTMVSVVGDDERGQSAIRILQGYGVDIRLLQIDAKAPTGTVAVKLDGSGKPTYTINDVAAWDHLQWSDELETSVGKADAVYFGTLAQRSKTSRQTIRRAVQVARDAGIPRILDINLRTPFFDAELIRESIALASVLKLSDDEMGRVLEAYGFAGIAEEDALQELLTNNALDLIVITRGAKGAMLVSSEGTVHQPGIPTRVRDTVGAGDAFMAIFVLGLLKDESYDSLLENACEFAATICADSGAVPPPTSPPINLRKR